MADTYIIRASKTNLAHDIYLNFGMASDESEPDLGRRAPPLPPGDRTTRFTNLYVFIGYGTGGNWETNSTRGITALGIWTRRSWRGGLIVRLEGGIWLGWRRMKRGRMGGSRRIGRWIVIPSAELGAMTTF